MKIGCCDWCAQQDYPILCVELDFKTARRKIGIQTTRAAWWESLYSENLKYDMLSVRNKKRHIVAEH